MTPLLEQAFARVRTLPPAEQDRIARVVLAVLDELEAGPSTLERLRAICAKHIAMVDAPYRAGNQKV